MILPSGVPQPLGLVETEQMPEGGLPHLAYGFDRIPGERTRVGMDIGVEYSILPNLIFNGTYSHEFKYIYSLKEAEDRKLFPNFPRNKFRLGLNFFQLPNSGFRANVNVQYEDAWNVDYGIYTGKLPARTIVDASIGYKWFNYLSIDITASNVFDKG